MKKFAILLVLVCIYCVANADNRVEKKITPYKHETVTRVDESVRVSFYTFTISDIKSELIEFLKSRIAEKVPNGTFSVKVDDCLSIWHINDECQESIILTIKEPVSIQITPKE